MMKRFLCFVCGRKVVLREATKMYGLTCKSCLEIMADVPANAQKLLSFIFRRLENLENR
jgi:ribosomal protein L37AE/L43A